jgi:hypothetical protein
MPTYKVQSFKDPEILAEGSLVSCARVRVVRRGTPRIARATRHGRYDRGRGQSAVAGVGGNSDAPRAGLPEAEAVNHSVPW